MTNQKSVVERAFELARDGKCQNMREIKTTLKKEQFSNVTDYLSGPSIKRQISMVIRQRRLGAEGANATPTPLVPSADSQAGPARL